VQPQNANGAKAPAMSGNMASYYRFMANQRKQQQQQQNQNQAFSSAPEDR
jgi:hypothetical protein